MSAFHVLPGCRSAGLPGSGAGEAVTLLMPPRHYTTFVMGTLVSSNLASVSSTLASVSSNLASVSLLSSMTAVISLHLCICTRPLPRLVRPGAVAGTLSL